MRPPARGHVRRKNRTTAALPVFRKPTCENSQTKTVKNEQSWGDIPGRSPRTRRGHGEECDVTHAPDGVWSPSHTGQACPGAIRDPIISSYGWKVASKVPSVWRAPTPSDGHKSRGEDFRSRVGLFRVNLWFTMRFLLRFIGSLCGYFGV